MNKEFFAQLKSLGMPVFYTESYCNNIVSQDDLVQNIQTLKSTINKNPKVALIHSENLQFYKNFSSEFIELVLDNKDRFVVFAEGIDAEFPFAYKQHNNFCMEVQITNKDLPRIDHSVKHKDLLVLVGRNDINRINLVRAMERHELLYNSYVSVNAAGPPFDCMYNLEEDIEDYKNDPYRLCKIPYVPHYQNSKLSVVMETNMEDKSYQLSEKIFKPIMTEHPFVVLGPPGFLKFLKTHGYKTFSSWIDESYDDEQDINKRISMIAKVCRDLLNTDVKAFYEQSAGVRLHNRTTFFNTKSISLLH